MVSSICRAERRPELKWIRTSSIASLVDHDTKISKTSWDDLGLWVNCEAFLLLSSAIFEEQCSEEEPRVLNVYAE